MLTGSGLTEERVKCIVAATDCLVAWHLAIWLDSMLEAEELPTCIANLDPALAEMEAEDFTHDCKGNGEDKLCSKSN
jgi:hypothetical protein